MDKRREEILAKCTLADCGDARELVKDEHALAFYVSTLAKNRWESDMEVLSSEALVEEVRQRMRSKRLPPGSRTHVERICQKMFVRARYGRAPRFFSLAERLRWGATSVPPWWERTQELLIQSFEQAGTYRMASSRWAGGGNRYNINPMCRSPAPDNVHLLDLRRAHARRDSLKVRSQNGKWTGHDSEATFNIPWNWWLKIYLRRGPYVLRQGRRMLVLDVDEVKDQVAFVCPGRGFEIWVATHSCGEVTWEGQDEPGDPHRRALQRTARG